MGGIPNQGFDLSSSSSSPKNPMALSSQQDVESNAFVSLNVGSLSLLAAAATTEKDSLASPRLMKTLSRKGSQRVGEKTAEAELARAFDGGTDKEAFLLQVAGDGEGCTANHATTPTAKWKRITGRRSSSLIDPRRVLIFFATLSSMGTLILIYFTISMSMASSDANAR